jgi:hypothetical protein
MSDIILDYVDISTKSEANAVREMLSRLLEHMRFLEPLVTLHSSARHYFGEFTDCVLNERPVKSPDYGLWEIVWSCMYQTKAGALTIVAGAEFTHFFCLVGDTMKMYEAVVVPRLTALLALNEIHRGAGHKPLIAYGFRGKDEPIVYGLEITPAGCDVLRLSGKRTLTQVGYLARNATRLFSRARHSDFASLTAA